MASNIAIRLGVVGVLVGGGFIYSQVAGGGARVREANNLADEGCACKTAACAENAGTKFMSWLHEHAEEEVDTSDADAVEAAGKRLLECVDHFVSAPDAT